MSTSGKPNAEFDPAGFIGRWSKRKSQARTRGTRASPTTTAEAQPVGQPTIHSPAESPVKLSPIPSEGLMPASEDSAGDIEPTKDARNNQLQPIDPAPVEPIPPIESLNENSDYSRFMAPDIGADLRRLALKKLFKAPVFGIRDGLDDYDDDFTSFEALGNIVTADMKFHQDRKELAEQTARDEEERLAQANNQPTINEPAAPSTVAPDESTPATDSLDTADTAALENDTKRETPPSVSTDGAPTVTPLRPVRPEPAPPIMAGNASGQRLQPTNPANTQET